MTGGEVPVDFASDEPGLRLLVPKQEDLRQDFEEVCDAPCKTAMAPGTYRMALSMPGKDTIETDEITLHGPSTLKGHVEYRGGARLTLTVVGGLTDLAGLILLGLAYGRSHDVCVSTPGVPGNYTPGPQFCHSEASPPDTGLAVAGAIALALGTSLIIARFFAYRDQATVEVVPVTSFASGLKSVALEGLRSTVAPEGIAVRLKF